MLHAAQRKSRVGHRQYHQRAIHHYSDTSLENLVERLYTMAYKPQPVLRIYIPKAGSQRKRPLGIPTLEDKLVQSGLVWFSQNPTSDI